jgi:paraquat-inducible protein B
VTSEQPKISKSSSISTVWFIPILALLLGAYMVIQSLLTQGPEIEIAFNTAEGLEQGKTQIKYRNVDIGVIQKVSLSKDFEGVVATAKLDKSAEPLLREDTRFWVVTARVGLDRISNLETLLSGAYIQLSPGTSEKSSEVFTALDQPPLTPTDADGLRLQLISPQASSISTGDAILYKGFRVGRVESTTFDPASRLVRYVVFIDAPYHKMINSSVRFWDVSGFSVTAGADGVKITTGSMDTVLLGGVAFEVPPGFDQGDTVEHNTEFRLYDSYDEILKNPYKHGTYYVISFTQSIKGLQPGAAIEYRGVPIGRVERILLRETMQVALSTNAKEGRAIPVLVYVEPARLELPDRQESIDALREIIEVGVRNGMRATLEYGSLITGAKIVSIDYYPDAEPQTIGTFINYSTIPAVETGLDQLQQQVASMLNMLTELPLDETISNANSALASFDQTMGSLDAILASDGAKKLPVELEATLQELRAAMQSLVPGSAVYESMDSSLLKLNRVLDNVETFTGTLAEQPNSVILPSDSPADPIPEAKP